MKKFISFALVLVAFTGVWFAVNLSPRTLEPPLWTMSDLASAAEEKGGNGFHYLMELQDKTELKEADVPEALYDLLPLKFADTSEQSAAYWDAAKTHGADLSEFLGRNSEALADLAKLVEFPQFIDQETPDFRRERTKWTLLNDYGEILSLSMVHDVLAGNPDAAYDLWLKKFRMHRSWFLSARSLLSQRAAAVEIDRDLVMLSLLRAYPSESRREDVMRALSEFDPEKADIHRPLVFDYLSQLSTAEAVATDLLREKSALLSLVYNPALLRKDLNERFRRLEQGTPDPGPKKGPFWWFYNPAGALFHELVFVTDMAKEIDKWNDHRKDLILMRTKLLGK